MSVGASWRSIFSRGVGVMGCAVCFESIAGILPILLVGLILFLLYELGCCDAPEKEVDAINHGSILVVYDVELTKAGCRLTAVSRTQIVEALRFQSLHAFNRLPAAWREAFHAQKGPNKKNLAPAR
eukprot:2148173-Pleurochrysis_carterae.AAC.1